MFATFIDKYQPAVIIKFPTECGTYDQKLFDEYLRTFRALYDRGECFNILIDGRDVESFPPSYILQHGLFLSKYKKLTAQYIKKSAVICGPTMEKCLNLLFSVYTPESDMIVTQDFRKGLIHVLDKEKRIK